MYSAYSKKTLKFAKASQPTNIQKNNRFYKISMNLLSFIQYKIKQQQSNLNLKLFNYKY